MKNKQIIVLEKDIPIFERILNGESINGVAKSFHVSSMVIMARINRLTSKIFSHVEFGMVPERFYPGNDDFVSYFRFHKNYSPPKSLPEIRRYKDFWLSQCDLLRKQYRIPKYRSIPEDVKKQFEDRNKIWEEQQANVQEFTKILRTPYGL